MYIIIQINFKNVSPLNNGQHFGDRECPLFKGFTVLCYIYFIFGKELIRFYP
jgi:hypothetical protein